MSYIPGLFILLFFLVVLINTFYTYFWFALILPLGMFIIWIYYLRASYLWMRFMTVYSSIVSDGNVDKKYGEIIQVFTDSSLERNKLLSQLLPYNHSKWSYDRTKKLDLNLKLVNPQALRESLTKVGISEYPFQAVDFLGSLKRNGKEFLRYIPESFAKDWSSSKIKANKFANYFLITSVSSFLYLIGKFALLSTLKLQSLFLIIIDFLWFSFTLVATYFVITTYKRGVGNEKELLALKKKEEDEKNELRLLKESASALGYTGSAEAEFIEKQLKRRANFNEKFKEESFFEFFAD